METKNEFITRVDNVSVQKGNTAVLDDISFQLQKGDHLAITGPSGSGKTTLGLALAGKIFYKGKIEFADAIQQNIVWVEQQHHFKNRFNTTDLYYQQRFNSYDSEETQTVLESLQGNSGDVEMVLRRMRIEYLRNKPLIQLSNGENKKMQIAAALLLQPSVLIMDQPFIGLDTETRKYLQDLLDELVQQGIGIILITTPDEIPACVTKVMVLEKGKLISVDSRDKFLENFSNQKKAIKPSSINREKLEELSSSAFEDFRFAIRMNNINVQYGERKYYRALIGK
ncbi:MAG: ABC transporter ATP-binding protein [Chitinophagaceae bacterium]